jgi:hypothetical protein
VAVTWRTRKHVHDGPIAFRRFKAGAVEHRGALAGMTGSELPIGRKSKLVEELEKFQG